MRLELTKREKANSSTLAAALDKREKDEEVKRTGRQRIVHDVNGGFATFPERIKQHEKALSELVDSTERATRRLWWERQKLGPARALHYCKLASDKDLHEVETKVKKAQTEVEKADELRRMYLRAAKRAREENDPLDSVVGDRCFVTFRYAADANAALRAFAPPPCGSKCCDIKDDEGGDLARQLRVTRAPERGTGAGQARDRGPWRRRRRRPFREREM